MELGLKAGTVHYLKTESQFFKDVKSGARKFEVRENDRDYQVGDTLILEEVEPESKKHTGAWVPERVIYKLDDPRFIKENFIILGIEEIKV